MKNVSNFYIFKREQKKDKAGHPGKMSLPRLSSLGWKGQNDPCGLPLSIVSALLVWQWWVLVVRSASWNFYFPLSL